MAAAVWALAYSRSEAPLRTELDVARNLMRDFRYGEFVATTTRVNLGSPRGQALTTEVERRLRDEAVGVLSRHTDSGDFAWLVGKRPTLELDVLQPRDRVLTLRLAKGVEGKQAVTVFFNGHEAGRTGLRPDGEFKRVSLDIPARWQHRGRNQVLLEFDVTESHQLFDQPVALPFSGIATALLFEEVEASTDGADGEAGRDGGNTRNAGGAEPVGGPGWADGMGGGVASGGDADGDGAGGGARGSPRPVDGGASSGRDREGLSDDGDDVPGRPESPSGVETLRDADGVHPRLVVAADTSARVALRLPDASRVVLRLELTQLDVPLEASLVTDDGRRSLLGAYLPEVGGVPREVRVDLSPWIGQPVLLELWAREGEGLVALSRCHLLMPVEELAGRIDDDAWSDEEQEADLLGRRSTMPWPGGTPPGGRALSQAATLGGDVEGQGDAPSPAASDDTLAARGEASPDPTAGEEDEEAQADATRAVLPERPSFLVVVLDALARRFVSHHGEVEGTTPRLDALAARSLVAPAATAPASYTLASVGALLTGRSPGRHGVVLVADAGGFQRLDDSLPTLASRLSDEGWRTAAWITNPNAAARHGYDQGFDAYVELFDPALGLWQEGVDGEHLPERLGAFLDGSADEPFLAYVHVFEPHAPYRAPDDLKQRFIEPYRGEARGTRRYLDQVKREGLAVSEEDWQHLRRLYSARTALADRVLGALLDELSVRGRDDVVVLVTSDHGEAFGQHGTIEHGDLVDGAQTDVPFVLHVPGRGAGELPGRVSLEDVAPTLLGLAGLSPSPSTDGFDLLAGALPDDRPLLARSASTLPVFSWTRGRWRLVVDSATRRRQLFDLVEDPEELNDVADDHPATSLMLYGELVRAVTEDALVRHAVDAQQTRQSLDPELAEQLAQIGYTGNMPQGEDDPDAPLAEDLVVRSLRIPLRRL